ncbi:MAG: hypothetical protein O7E52_14465 [Candidatus Poribacteria bacterium]|nr:hypothetical protein [Candidatus Poribacteria bacterium]
MSERLGQVIPPYVSGTSIATKAKDFCRATLRTTFTIVALFILVFGIFLAYRVVKERDTFWHYLKNNQTIAFTLTPQKTMQDAAIDDILTKLTEPGQSLQQKLIELAVSGYAQSDWYQQRVIVYDEKLRADYQMTFEQRVQTAIDQAYRIYNNFDAATEREVYGSTTDELVYQVGLQMPGYAPMALRKSLFEGRRYFPFALIAGQMSGIDPLRLLKIFEIETDFDETTVGHNTGQIINDDIGIAQNNLVVLPRLIRDILDPETPVYSPFFEFLYLGTDLETGKPLTWSNYLVRLEEELNGTYNRQKDPTGRYYINLLKAPHIGAFLAAYHIKRDQTYRLYPECMTFYRKNAAILKRELKLTEDLNPYHWTDYSFYNGGPKRWYVMQKFVTMRQDRKPIPPELAEAVQIMKRRNMVAQKLGQKNEYLRNLAFDPLEDKIIENDGLFRYGLYDFASNFKPRELMYNLNQDLAVAP